MAVIHVVRLGCHIDQLIHAEHREIHPDVDVNGAHPGHGRANRHTRHGVLGKRGVENPFFAEPLLKALRGSLYRFVVVHIEPEQEDARVALHLLRDALA